MEKYEIDLVLKGVVNTGYKVIKNLMTFKMFVTGAEMNNHHGSKWHFSMPTLISIHVRDFSELTPEDKYALSITGSEVRVHVYGSEEKLEVKILSVVGRTRRALPEFAKAIEESSPQISDKVHIDGDFKDQRIRLDA